MKRGWILLSTIVFLALISLIPTIALIAYSFLALDFLLTISSFWWILGPIIFFLVFVAIVYFVLAPNNLFFTFVHEGTAKWVVRSKKFSRCFWRSKILRNLASVGYPHIQVQMDRCNRKWRGSNERRVA
jgi:cellulose synthase/poly-beta-1,6-N-acetylglucosamine synthase-like glycosyltransferase